MYIPLQVNMSFGPWFWWKLHLTRALMICIFKSNWNLFFFSEYSATFDMMAFYPWNHQFFLLLIYFPLWKDYESKKKKVSQTSCNLRLKVRFRLKQSMSFLMNWEAKPRQRENPCSFATSTRQAWYSWSLLFLGNHCYCL